MKVSVDIDMKELLQKLRKTPDRIQDKVIRAGVRAGAGVVRSEARRNVPVDTGLMKSKVKVQKARISKHAGNFVFVVNVASPAHHLIELGTKDREPIRKSKLHFTLSNGSEIYVDKVKGVQANPFLGKAYEATKEQVVRKFKTKIDTELKKL